MTKQTALLTLALAAITLSACATASPPSAGTLPSGNVPLVQVENDSYSDAEIYLEGFRLGTIWGSQTVLWQIPRAYIPLNGRLHFSVRLVPTDESANLPVVVYREGRKVRIMIEPMLSTSNAY